MHKEVTVKNLAQHPDILEQAAPAECSGAVRAKNEGRSEWTLAYRLAPIAKHAAPTAAHVQPGAIDAVGRLSQTLDPQQAASGRAGSRRALKRIPHCEQVVGG